MVTRRDGTPLARRDESVPAVEDPVSDAPSAAIDIAALARFSGASYPPPHDAAMARRSWLRLGAAAGLTRLGVNLVTIAPGGLSSLRHWHAGIDEFLILRKGELTLIEDDGETAMRPGDCAAFPAGNGIGHHLRNDTDAPAVFLVLSDTNATDTCHYSDVDLVAYVDGPRRWYARRDGTVVKEF
ncbi:MAG: transcriptional regulator [Rhodovulum sulfidophilum]|uniref:Transcriptional regulator n=1 Tax=Rhodovulum sulfidophilum TaxID=35806 RepID=A0A2W5QCA9_RHOSU|nr:MAG: transcriptional regulator [Rhodovulum sulfidophilum]